MPTLITQSGPLVWPLLLLAAAALVFAVQFARTARRELMALAAGSTLAALIVALLAVLLGFQRSVAHLGEVAAESRWIFLLGLGESLSGLVLALVVALLVTFLWAIGRYRALRGGVDALPAPAALR